MEIEELNKKITEMQSKILEIDRCLKAIFEALVSIESETGDEHVPPGEYYGNRFE